MLIVRPTNNILSLEIRPNLELMLNIIFLTYTNSEIAMSVLIPLMRTLTVLKVIVPYNPNNDFIA